MLNELVARLRAGRELAAMALDTARRSQDAVWSRIEGHLPQMTSSEARGFIRARSAAIIWDAVDEVLWGRDARWQALRPQLIALATDEVVRLVHSRASVHQMTSHVLGRAA